MISSETRPVIAVTGINASDNPAPGLGVIKSLKHACTDTEIIGLAYDAMEPGIYLDEYLDRSFMIPYPSAGEEVLVERLLYIQSKTGLNMVIPTLDSEIPFYIRAADELRKHGITTFLPSMKQFRSRDKINLAAIAEQAGINFPEQEVIHSSDELIACAGKLGFPLIIKGAQYTAHYANNMHEALSHFSTVAARWGFPVIVQQVVTGEEMNVIGIGDGEGGTPGLVAIKKISKTDIGKIWTGVTVNHPGLLKAARDFVGHTKWRGAFELECIVHSNKVHLIEINPRFPAWVYFATQVGINLPELLVQCADDKPLALDAPHHPVYDTGKLYIRYTEEKVCNMSTLQNMVTLGESL